VVPDRTKEHMKGLLFTYCLTYGGAFASLCRPMVGLVIYILFAIIKPEHLWTWSLPSHGQFSRIIAISLVAGWLLQGGGGSSLGRSRLIVWSFAAFWAWSIVSAIFAPDWVRSWLFIETIGKILLPFCVGMALIKSVNDLRVLAWTIVLGHGFLALEFNRYWFSGYNFIKEVGFAGMEEGSIAIGMVTASGLAFQLGLMEVLWWRKLVAFGCTGLIVHVVLFSFSRGGMIALIVAGIASLVVLPRRPMSYAVLAAVAALTFAAAGPEVRARFATAFADQQGRDASAQSRLDLWKNCIQVMAENPVFGIGPYHFPTIAESFGWKRGKEAHTLWLQIGAELGVVGLGLLLTFYGGCVARVFPYAMGWKRCEDPWIACLARGVVTSTIGFAVAAQFISLWSLEVPYYVVLIGAGLLKIESLESPGLRPGEMPLVT